MSRKNRRNGGGGHSPAVVAPDLTPRTDMAPFGGIGYGTMGYQGAAYSGLRGYIYWPTLDARKEIDTWTRLEIARKVHWARANLGLARRILQGLTNLIVGTGLIPHATTTDTEWNHLAEACYKARSNSPLAYSVNGRHTSAQAQRLMVGTRLADGDAAVVFASSQSGGALRQFYSGVQIGNANRTDDPSFDQEDWHDGINYDALDRAATYRFPDQEVGFTDIDAANVRFLCRYETPGQRRGVSILAHAVNKMVDLTELNTFIMQGIKQSNQIGYYLTSDSEEKRQGMNANLTGGPVQKVMVQGAQGQLVPMNLAQIYGQGGYVPSLPKGVDIKTLLDARPHQNSQAFVEEFIRDISWGSGIASDLLWNIYKLGGANVRYILADAQVFVSAEQQDLVDTWLAQDWAWTIAKEMKAGRLRRCKDPVWWAHGWIPPARVTVDYGRDGRILLDFHKYGLLTTTRFYGMQGQTARKEITGELELIAWRKGEMSRLKLTPDDLQLYNPILPRAPVPTKPGDENYGATIHPDKVNPGDDDESDEEDGFDETTSQDRLHGMVNAAVHKEVNRLMFA